MDFSADFITNFTAVFIMDFTTNFMLNPSDFIIDFLAVSLHIPGFHQNQKDFMKSTAFHRISLKSTGFHYGFHFGFHSSGRSTDFMPEIWQIHEIHQISWNPPDFMKSTGFHAWSNLNQIIQEKLFTFIECRGCYVTWNHEIWWILGGFHMKSTNPIGFY